MKQLIYKFIALWASYYVNQVEEVIHFEDDNEELQQQDEQVINYIYIFYHNIN